MSIRFNEESLGSTMLVSCSGSAVIAPDGKTKYRFLYNFMHSRDWKKISRIRIEQPGQQFSTRQLREFGKQIAHLINYFISRSN
jgi:hypothetical protein